MNDFNNYVLLRASFRKGFRMKKKIIRHFMQFAVVCIVIIGFILINEQITDYKTNSFIFSNDSCDIAYQVEYSGVENEDFVIKGWFFELKSFRNNEREVDDNRKPIILLYDINSEKKDKNDKSENEEMLTGIAAKLEWYDRPDVNAYFSCQYNYTRCGFTARIPKGKIDLEDGQYQIIIKYLTDNSDFSGIGSTTFIDKGKLSYINPKDKIELDVDGTYLESIVNEGICVISYPEFHIAVYQKDWKLYWIADEEYSFEEDASTYIQYQIDTTQFDKLPTGKNENGPFWGNMGGYFEEGEITGIKNCGKYRVYMRDIPKDYSVVIMATGYYDNGEWKWRRYFRPIYNDVII